eukprot:30139-Pelagococcus_subviridis.AAC.6
MQEDELRRAVRFEELPERAVMRGQARVRDVEVEPEALRDLVRDERDARVLDAHDGRRERGGRNDDSRAGSDVDDDDDDVRGRASPRVSARDASARRARREPPIRTRAARAARVSADDDDSSSASTVPAVSPRASPTAPRARRNRNSRPSAEAAPR